ncbi:Sodium/nucleoside cotransporter 1 [Hypsibius exemplaris]|uniref:Sodium/nucleoside cotransporter 1 n=1 Tax=Hypsibius exemplaris TaxID=2072580 RepID=A0A1W0W966_HYPEX|nr:Sodium/nucleoside cotransporter 1 [Hypsibius exemplaris]
MEATNTLPSLRSGALMQQRSASTISAPSNASRERLDGAKLDGSLDPVFVMPVSMELREMKYDLDGDPHKKEMCDDEKDSNLPASSGIFGHYERMRSHAFGFITRNRKTAKMVFWVAVLFGYIGYLAYVLWLNFQRAQNVLWGTLAVVALVAYYKLVKPFAATPLNDLVVKAWSVLRPHRSRIQLVLLLLYLTGVAVFLGIDTAKKPERLRALAGIAIFLIIGVVFSERPGHINWRVIASGTAVQFAFGLIVLRWDSGKNALEWLGNFLQNVLSFANDGASFVFSPGEKDHNMAFVVMPILLFASFLIAILYHIGAMGWFVEKIGWGIHVLLGTTKHESISAAANVFLGMTEAPLVIKPFINELTRSEIFAVMAGGFATISGSLMVTFASMGVNAKYLLAASVMNAPSALVLSKLLYPEVEKSRASETKDVKRDKGQAYNVLDAAMMAASQSVTAIGNILAMLICAIAFLALVNGFLGFVGGLADYSELSLALISGYLFYPIAYLMGVDPAECRSVGQLLGYKTFLNEFVAYTELNIMMKEAPLSDKGLTIATYALCGFANFSSVGIQLANFTVMAPNRKKDIASLVLRALLAGFLANLLTAKEIPARKMSQRNRASAPPAKASPLDAVLANPYVAKLKDKAVHYRDEVEAWLKSSDNFLAPYATLAEQKTGVNRAYIFAGILGVITLLLLFGGQSFAGFLSHLITFLYPAIASLKALETRQKDDDTKWLTYWVVFGFLGLFEFVGETLLSVLPFYYVVKTAFQLWLCLPGDCNGSLIVYHRVLRPLAVRFLKIDSGSAKGKIGAHLNNAADKTASFIRETETKVREEINSKDD